MASPQLDDIHAETDRIQTACDLIEIALMNIEHGDDWRIALGYIDAANRRLYQTRKRMLDEAIRQANDHTHGRTSSD